MDRESVARVTVCDVETVLAALTGRESARNRRTRTQSREATGVSELVATQGHFDLGWDFAESGRKLPREPGDPRSDSGVVKTLDSSVQMGATRLVHAGRKS